MLNFLAGYFLLLALSIVLYKSKHNFKRIIFTTLFIYILGMLLEAGTAITLQAFGYSFEETIFSGSIISKLILLAIIHALTILKVQQEQNEPATFYWCILCIATISSIIIIYIVFLFARTTESTSLQTWASSCMLALLVLNMALFIMYNKLSKSADLHIKNAVLKQQINYYDHLIESKKQQQNLFHQERHNMKNQLIALRTYAANNQNTEMISFITRLLNDEEFGLTPFSYCDNILIDAILSSKNSIADKYNIKYTLDINVPSTLPFDNIDLCILLGNILDNAFDANMNSTPNKDSFVSVTLQYKNAVLYCHVSNSFSHKLDPSSAFMFKSTKSDKQLHGYGLATIKRIADKYHGVLDIVTQENIFSLKLSLYEP